MSFNESQADCDSRKQRLKKLLDESEELKLIAETQDKMVTLAKMNEIILQSEEINDEACLREGVPTAAELMIDAEILYLNHEIMTIVLERAYQTFDLNAYANAINKCVAEEGQSFWQRIGQTLMESCRTASFKPSMLGAFERDISVIEKVDKQREKEPRNVNKATEISPDAVESLGDEDKGAKRLILILKEIRKIYEDNGREPIPFYKIIIDPHNFSYSVYNAFQLMFLVRSGSIAMLNGKDGYPAIRLTTKSEKKDATSESNHSACSFNANTWKAMIKFYDIKEAMLSSPAPFT